MLLEKMLILLYCYLFYFAHVLVKGEEVEEVKTEKQVKATKKGSAVLDQWLPDNIKSQYHVLEKVISVPLF